MRCSSHWIPHTCLGAVVSLILGYLITPAVSFIPTNDLNYVGASFGVPGFNASFDYVVVGGGTAGAAMAERLAQDGRFSVALVEAGSFYEIDNGNHSVVPSGVAFFTGASPQDYNPLVDWHVVTVPQAGFNGRQVHYTRGKCLGGSSARNYFLYHLPTRDSLTQWATAVGDNSYQFDSFLKYYQASVDYTQPNNAKRAANASYTYNGTNFGPTANPLQVTLPNYANAFSSYYLQGLAQAGVPGASDFVSGTLNGATYAMVTLDPKDMTRSSSESSYWRLALQKTGLITYQKTLAKKILFNGKKATGVLVDSQGVQYSLTANKEVIVSNGAFQSPQLLMVSGIGPQTTLSGLGIPVVQNLPGVGQNMWDQIYYGPSYQVNVLTHSILGNPVLAGQANTQYIKDQTGVVGNPGGDIIGWEKTPKGANLSASTKAALATFPADWPALEYFMIDAFAGDNENYILGSPQTPFQYAAAITALVAPLSRGNVTIKSADTNDLPVVNPNWFTDPADQEVGIAAFKRLREVMSTPAMKKIIIGDEVFPGLNVTTDAQILNYIKNTAITIWHAAATCKMGTSTDPMAVVDPQARVYGVTGLRVVDASAFPFLPPGHPQSTVYALAEKIAQNILTGSTTATASGT